MSWGLRFKEIVEVSPVFDTVLLKFEFYSKLGREFFAEDHSFTVDSSWEDLRSILLKKLEVLNVFRSRVEELKTQIGRIVDPAQAISLGLSAESPVFKTPPEPAVALKLTSQPPIPKQ